MDEFAQFNFLLLDASAGSSRRAAIVAREPDRRERVDLVSRQFLDFMRDGDPEDTSPHGIALTRDFKLRRQAGKSAGWLAFLVDRGLGATEELEEVARVVFARSDDAERQAALRWLGPFVDVEDIPAAPMVVAVSLVPRAKVPSAISEWYGKAVAGFFAADS